MITTASSANLHLKKKNILLVIRTLLTSCLYIIAVFTIVVLSCNLLTVIKIYYFVSHFYVMFPIHHLV